ncbi:hypothetical protein ACWDR0_31320 [Streptomyces sp. NPDC003691]
MTRDKWVPAVLHLLLVWAAMTAAVPVLGFVVLASAWAAGLGAAAVAFAVGVPLTLGLLALTGLAARDVVPMCATGGSRLGWSFLVFVLGTLGVVGGLAVYGQGVDLGSGTARYALTGVPYAVAAALFVPGWHIRLGAVAVLAAGIAYGSVIGPERVEDEQQQSEVARYKERAELLHLGTAPPGMQLTRAELGPAWFGVEYRGIRQDEFSLVMLAIRRPSTPAIRCPLFREPGATCSVGAGGDIRTVRKLPGGGQAVILARRHGGVEAEVNSETLDEAGLRRLLDTLRPVSDAELEKLIREKKISFG